MPIFPAKLLVFLVTVFAPIGVVFAEEEKNSKSLTVLVTGANRGLGLEYCKQYQAAGHHVIGTARKPKEAYELKETGVEVLALDVTSDEEIAALVESLKGRRIDILINNAGVYIREANRKAVELSFSVNAVGPLLLSQALLPNLSLSDSPKIINISSRTSILTDGTGRSNGYAMSKTALNMVTRILHTRLHKKGMIVISLAPGRNQTAMGGKRAPMTPQESVPKIMALIASLEKSHSGRFWYFDGKELPW